MRDLSLKQKDIVSYEQYKVDNGFSLQKEKYLALPPPPPQMMDDRQFIITINLKFVNAFINDLFYSPSIVTIVT